MDRAEFDKFAAEYRAMHARNIRITGESPEYFAEYKIKDLARELGPRATAETPLRILDFGAGIGNSVPYFRTHLAHAELTCLDVSRKSLEIGEKRFPGQAQFVEFDGNRIPFDDAYFDVVFASCVFHHIPHHEHVALLRELRRVLRADGQLFLFEHNPLNPLTVHAVNTCPFDENARLIGPWAMHARVRSAGFGDCRTRFRLFFPKALGGLRPLEAWLRWMPLGAQYYIAARPATVESNRPTPHCMSGRRAG